MTPIYILEKRFLSRGNLGESAATAKLFVKKWHLHIEINLMVAARKSFAFVSQV